MTQASNSQANNSLLSTFSNESFGLAAKVRRSKDVFEVVVVDAMSGEEILSTHRLTQEEAEKFAFGLMNPSHDTSAIRRDDVRSPIAIAPRAPLTSLAGPQ